MRTYPIATAGLVVAGTLAGMYSASSYPAQAQPTDYTRLLIQASDIHAPESFTADPPQTRAMTGGTDVMTTFRNPDGTHVIYDSVQIAADPAAATRTLESRKVVAQQGTVHGWPEPIDIGTGGATIDGPSPDGSKSVTDLLFTEGKAFVEIEFDGQPNRLVPPDLVNDVGQKQDAAIKEGLAG